jgi:hypothetical protein
MGSEQFDWALQEAVEIVEFLSKGDQVSDWGFTIAIDNAIAVIDDEEKAQREREAAAKAHLEKARHKAMLVRDSIIVPLLNDLRDDFAADEKKLLPEWKVQSTDDANTFLGTAATTALNVGRSASFLIKAEASVVEGGDFMDFSVMCSSPQSDTTSAAQLAPLFNITEKYPTAHKFDEAASRTWFYKQLTECARMCILAKMRE